MCGYSDVCRKISCKRETADVCCPQDLRSNWFVMCSLDLTKTFSLLTCDENTIIKTAEPIHSVGSFIIFFPSLYVYARYFLLCLSPSIFLSPIRTAQFIPVCMCVCVFEFFNSEKIRTIFQWQHTSKHKHLHIDTLTRPEFILRHSPIHTSARTHSCERVEPREEESWKKRTERKNKNPT